LKWPYLEKQKKKISKTEPDTFSLFLSNTEKIKSVVAEQARISFSKNLQEVGVSASESDNITASIVDLIKKGNEISQQLTKEIDTAIDQKRGLDKIQQKNLAQQQETIRLQNLINELQEKKNNKEKMIGIIASGLTLSVSNIGIGTQSKVAVKGLLEQLKVPGVEYGIIASQVASEIFRGIKKMKEDNYNGNLKENMVYYSGTFVPSVGGWLFGQSLPTGKMYVRLDTPCDTLPGHVYVEHRELKLKNTYPFKDAKEQIGLIMAQEFGLGDYKCNLLPRSTWSNLFG